MSDTSQEYYVRVCPACRLQVGRGDQGQDLCRDHGEVDPTVITTVPIQRVRDAESWANRLADAIEGDVADDDGTLTLRRLGEFRAMREEASD